MPTTDQDRVVVALDDSECRALLPTERIGRIGFTRNALPAIHPVTYYLHDGQVIIPALPGSEYLRGTRDTVVAFQVDAYDDSTRTGWSVTVVGPSRHVCDATEVAACDALPWPLPTTEDDRCYVAVRIGMVRGWRTTPAPSAPIGASSTCGGAAPAHPPP